MVVIVLQLALGATRCRSSSATRRIPISRPLLNAATSIWQTARVPFNARHLLRLLSQMLIELAVRKHHTISKIIDNQPMLKVIREEEPCDVWLGRNTNHALKKQKALNLAFMA